MTRKERYLNIMEYFSNTMPDPDTELKYPDPFGLVVAVILSAQCTDKRVNLITPDLLRKYPDPFSMSKAEPSEIFEYIRSCSYPNSKAKHLVGMARMLVKDYNGIIPSEPSDLQKLPGVGRKTANVVASVLYRKPVIAVDTHVFRVAARTGLVRNAKTPLSTELQLSRYIPSQLMHKAHHWLILHGRYTCRARNPLCGKCGISSYCRYFSMKKAQN